MEFMRGKKINHEVANCVCPPAQPNDDADNGDHQGESLPNPHHTLLRKGDQCIHALRLCSKFVLNITSKYQYKLLLCSDSWYPIELYIHRLISPLNFQHINTGHNAGQKRKSTNLCFQAVFTLGSRVLLQDQPKLVLCSDTLHQIVHYIHRLIGPFNYRSPHKHRSQHWSQKKINQVMLSGCVRTWFSNTDCRHQPRFG